MNAKPEYQNLFRREKLLLRDQLAFINKVLKQHGGRISLKVDDKDTETLDPEDIHPASTTVSGYGRTIYITSLYIELSADVEYIFMDGLYDSDLSNASTMAFPCNYSDIMVFIAHVLDLK